jgi:hypothetical protein
MADAIVQHPSKSSLGKGDKPSPYTQASQVFEEIVEGTAMQMGLTQKKVYCAQAERLRRSRAGVERFDDPGGVIAVSAYSYAAPSPAHLPKICL